MRIRARISLLADSNGKVRTRRNPYRPNHNFGSADNVDFMVAQIEIPGDRIRSGEAQDAIVEFLTPEALRPILRPGMDWRIQEGATLVGCGKVLEILD